MIELSHTSINYLLLYLTIHLGVISRKHGVRPLLLSLSHFFVHK